MSSCVLKYSILINFLDGDSRTAGLKRGERHLEKDQQKNVT